MPARATSFSSKVTNAMVRSPSSNPHGILVILPNCTYETSVYEFREHMHRPQQLPHGDQPGVCHLSPPPTKAPLRTWRRTTPFFHPASCSPLNQGSKTSGPRPSPVTVSPYLAKGTIEGGKSQGLSLLLRPQRNQPS